MYGYISNERGVKPDYISFVVTLYLFNDIWRVVRFGMYVLGYIIGKSVSATVEIKCDIQIIYYFRITLL